jgi:hypothetical protein
MPTGRLRNGEKHVNVESKSYQNLNYIFSLVRNIHTNRQAYMCPKSKDYNINLDVDISLAMVIAHTKTPSSTFKS